MCLIQCVTVDGAGGQMRTALDAMGGTEQLELRKDYVIVAEQVQLRVHQRQQPLCRQLVDYLLLRQYSLLVAPGVLVATGHSRHQLPRLHRSTASLRTLPCAEWLF